MLITLARHADAFQLASTLLPNATWRTAEGDVGQTSDGDVGLEDLRTGSTLLLRDDGAATLALPRLICASAMFRSAG